MLQASYDKNIDRWNIQNDFESVHTRIFGFESLFIAQQYTSLWTKKGLNTKWNLSNFTKIDSFKAHEIIVF